MINLPELLILDVGHGNCAILRDTQAVSVIDCGYDGSVLLRTLKRLKIGVVDHVLISHADSDHIGGLEPLIEALPIRNIYMNSDASKMGRMWKDTLRALELAEHLGTQVHIGLTSRYSQKIISGEVTIEILGPFSSKSGHLTNLPAKGDINSSCCGGTIRIKIDGERTTYNPSLSLHREFVKNLSEKLTKDASIQRQGGSIRSSEVLSGPLCLRYLTTILTEP